MATLYDVGGIIGDNMIILHSQTAMKFLISTPIQVVSLLEESQIFYMPELHLV